MAGADKKITRIDPFLLPSETQGRYLLLILLAYVGIYAIANTMGNFLAGRLIQHQNLQNIFGIVVGLAMVVLLHILTRHSVVHAAEREIIRSGARSGTDISATADEQHSISYVEQHVQYIVDRIPEIQKQPALLWRRDSQSELSLGGKAFGTNTHSLLYLYYGNYIAFRVEPNRPHFYHILLHELGHIANKDVSITTRSAILSYWFQRLAGAMFAIYMLGALLAHVQKIIADPSYKTQSSDLQFILLSTLQMLAVFFLVAIAFRSIIRIREYYADARAAIWIDDYTIMDNPADTSQDSPGSILHYLQTRLFDRFGHMHPTNKQRRDALQKPDPLFKISPEMCLFNGLLVGLVLNTSFQLVTSISGLILASRSIAAALEGSATIFYWLILILSVAVSSVLPLHRALAVQVQRAALADMAAGERRLSRLWTLWKSVLITACGIVMGAMLSPTTNALSLWGPAFLFAPVLAFLWSIPLLVWMLLLRAMIGKLFQRTLSAGTFKRYRRILAKTIMIGFMPILLMTTLTHILIGTLSAFPDMYAHFDADLQALFPLFIAGLWFVVLIVNIGVIGLGLPLVWKSSGLKELQCSNCDAVVSPQNIYCAQCSSVLRKWLYAAAPLTIPPVVIHSTQVVPPPLSKT